MTQVGWRFRPTQTLGVHGRLKADAFHRGKVAADAEDRVIYDRATGGLFYDADGTGAARPIKFAVIANKAALMVALGNLGI
jgi:Ca2+-binding RTX toxin-like protein